MNWLREKLNAIIDAWTALRDKEVAPFDPTDPFPPLPTCLICHQPTTWLIVARVFVCRNGHRFTPPELGVKYPPLPPKPEIGPGDEI